jgi:large exoprotein involved in heme utilization and adhesion
MKKTKKPSKNLQPKGKAIVAAPSNHELSDHQLDGVAGGSFSFGAVQTSAQNTIGSATGGAGAGKVRIAWSGPGDEGPEE